MGGGGDDTAAVARTAGPDKYLYATRCTTLAGSITPVRGSNLESLCCFCCCCCCCRCRCPASCFFLCFRRALFTVSHLLFLGTAENIFFISSALTADSFAGTGIFLIRMYVHTTIYTYIRTRINHAIGFPTAASRHDSGHQL